MVLATVSMIAPPTTHRPRRSRSASVGSSASRPATIEPREAAIAPISDIEKQR
jgi:hypothetical protein